MTETTEDEADTLSLESLLRGERPTVCTRCGDSLECPITNLPCPFCVASVDVEIKTTTRDELLASIHEQLDWVGSFAHPILLSMSLTTDDPSYCQHTQPVHLHISHPTPSRQTHPFSLHFLEWIRTGSGWWGALFGYCPRIGEGEVDGHSWHFHARGDRWTLVVGTTAGSWAEDEWVYGAGEYRFGGEYLSVEGSAGDMDDGDAWALIEQGFTQWRATMAEQHEEAAGRWEGEGGRCS